VVLVHNTSNFFNGSEGLVGLGLLIVEALPSLSLSLSHTHTHSVGLLWTSDRPDAETSTWQHTTFICNRYPYSCGIRTRNPRKQRPQTTP